MEVDFLCADARLVIELDGAQHLSDAEAYRRDRRKDAFLQENGYLVVRFLAEDLAKRLDEVLDAILRTLTHRERTIHGSTSELPGDHKSLAGSKPDS
jgi:very-short-patch-repair endonuclease